MRHIYSSTILQRIEGQALIEFIMISSVTIAALAGTYFLFKSGFKIYIKSFMVMISTPYF